jgi:hypothetical protein
MTGGTWEFSASLLQCCSRQIFCRLDFFQHRKLKMSINTVHSPTREWRIHTHLDKQELTVGYKTHQTSFNFVSLVGTAPPKLELKHSLSQRHNCGLCTWSQVLCRTLTQKADRFTGGCSLQQQGSGWYRPGITRTWKITSYCTLAMWEIILLAGGTWVMLFGWQESNSEG